MLFTDFGMRETQGMLQEGLAQDSTAGEVQAVEFPAHS